MRKKKEYEDVVDLMMRTRFVDCISEAALNRLNDENVVKSSDESSFRKSKQLKEYIDC